MPADQIGDYRGHAAIGHQLDPGTGHLIEHLGCQVHQRTVTTMTDRKVVWLLCHGDDLAKRFSPQRI